MENSKDDIMNALFKKAVGYTASETVTEYSVEDENLRQCKKKVTEKHIPPDITALKVLLAVNGEGGGIASMTDEELEKEKKRLLNLLSEYGKEGGGEEEGG